MPLNIPEDSTPLRIIDSWFRSRCDDRWEHDHGLTLETTDNPGWLMTIDESLDIDSISNLSTVVQSFGAELTLESKAVKVWSSSLYSCLQAAAAVLEECKCENAEGTSNTNEAFALGDRVQVLQDFNETKLQGATGIVANPPPEIVRDNDDWIGHWKTETLSSGDTVNYYWIKFDHRITAGNNSEVLIDGAQLSEKALGKIT